MSLLGVLLVVFTVVFLLLCAFIIIVVLIQPGKSGGLASLSSSQIEAPTALTETLGVGQSDRALFRLTMGGAWAFFILTFVLTFLGNARDRAAGQIDLPSETPAAAVMPLGEAPATGTTTIEIPAGGTTEEPAGETTPETTGEAQPPVDTPPATTP